MTPEPPDPWNGPLSTPTHRFPLGPPPEYWTGSADRPSAPGVRPYSLRGATELPPQRGPRAGYGYDPVRQVGFVRTPDGQIVQLAKHTTPGTTTAQTTGFPGDGNPQNPPPEEMGTPDYQTD